MCGSLTATLPRPIDVTAAIGRTSRLLLTASESLQNVLAYKAIPPHRAPDEISHLRLRHRHSGLPVQNASHQQPEPHSNLQHCCADESAASFAQPLAGALHLRLAILDRLLPPPS